MLYKYSLSETFREFVLLKLSSIYTSLPHLKYPMHVWFWKKHVRVLFEGNILLTAWLQDLHRQFNWVDFIPLISWRLSPPSAAAAAASVIHAQVFGFPLWETQKHSLAFFLSLLFSPLSAVFCEQTITCWRNNKSLLGNGTTSWEFCFQLINLMYLKFRSF